MLIRIKCRDQPLKKYSRLELKDLWLFQWRSYRCFIRTKNQLPRFMRISLNTVIVPKRAVKFKEINK